MFLFFIFRFFQFILSPEVSLYPPRLLYFLILLVVEMIVIVRHNLSPSIRVSICVDGLNLSKARIELLSHHELCSSDL